MGRNCRRRLATQQSHDAPLEMTEFKITAQRAVANFEQWRAQHAAVAVSRVAVQPALIPFFHAVGGKVVGANGSTLEWGSSATATRQLTAYAVRTSCRLSSP